MNWIERGRQSPPLMWRSENIYAITSNNRNTKTTKTKWIHHTKMKFSPPYDRNILELLGTKTDWRRRGLKMRKEQHLIERISKFYGIFSSYPFTSSRNKTKHESKSHHISWPSLYSDSRIRKSREKKWNPENVHTVKQNGW